MRIYLFRIFSFLEKLFERSKKVSMKVHHKVGEKWRVSFPVTKKNHLAEKKNRTTELLQLIN
jgi:hypothetical protein